jgi:hypothetical protein
MQDGAGLARGQADAFDPESLEGGGEVLTQQRAELVGELLAGQAASCWARASTAMDWTSSESSGSVRWWAASTRRTFAKVMASAWSLLDRATVWRSR